MYLQFSLSRKQIAHWNENVEVRRSKTIIEWWLFEPKYIAELRLYGMVRHLLDLRLKLRDRDEKDRIEFERAYIPKRLLADGVEAIAEVSSLVWIVLQIAARAQPLGNFIYVQQIVSRAMGAASGFASQLSSIDEDIANLFDYETFMNLPERAGGTYVLKQQPERIEFRDVSFRYPGEDLPEVLKNVSFSIEKGQHVAIVGENGAGKSTLLKLLTGVYVPTTGSVLVDGVSLEKYDIASWHAHLGVLQQDFVQYSFATAGENVRFGNVKLSAGDEAISAALKAAEAEGFVKKLPKGVDSYVNNWMESNDGVKGTQLSGGQWQRLALARNFFRDAPVIILDEPTSAIDALAEARIFKRLLRETKKTIVTVSHRVTTIKQADVIYMFEDGEIVEKGTHDELVAKKGRYRRMFEAQLK